MGSFRPVAGNPHLHGYYNFTESLVETVPRSLLFMAGWWFILYMYFEKTLRGYYLKKYSEQYRQLYGYSRDEWYGDKVDDWNRMKTIEKHLKLKEEERKEKSKKEVKE